MKKSVLTLIALFAVITLTYAQKAVKGSSMKAETLMKAGKLDEAKTEIENAVAYELAKLKKKGKKEVAKGKTYAIQGQVYQAIATTKGVDEKTQKDAIAKAMAAYGKVKEVEKENSLAYMVVYMDMGQPSLIKKFYGAFFDEGVKNYNAKDMTGAIKNFETAILVLPKDTTAALNVFASARIDGNEAKSVEYANKLIEWGMTKPRFYNYLASVALEKDDFDGALKTLDEGLKANPGNIGMMGTQINVYIKAGRADEAVKSIDEALKNDPKNYSMWLNKGLLSRDLGKLDEAEAALKKAVELNPTEIELYKELGGLFYNEARKKKKERENLPTTTIGAPLDAAKDAALKKEEYALYEKSLPHTEKYLELSPKDRPIIELLEYIYFKLGRKADADKMAKLLDNLPE